MQKIDKFTILICLILCTIVLLFVEFEKKQDKINDQFNHQQADIDELFLRTDELFNK